MRQVPLDLDDTVNLNSLDLDVATGIAMFDGGAYVRFLHVKAAREYTVPLAYETSQADALRLAAAVIKWDCGMMEQADDPLHAKGPKVPARQVIRSFLPKMLQCELRDVFVDTYGYAGTLR